MRGKQALGEWLSANQCGNREVFDKEESYIGDERTGGKLWLEGNKGMFMLKRWVPRGGSTSDC